MNCRKCGKSIPNDAVLCPYCGQKVTAEPVRKVCRNCGKYIPDDAVMCPYCGQQLYAAAPAVQAAPMPQPMPQMQPMPQPVSDIPTHIVGAVLVTLFCCLPFGIVSLIFGSKVSGLVAEGRIDEAMNASKKAKNWMIIGMILGILIIFLNILISVVTVIMQNM